MPDGEYRISSSDIAKILDMSEKSFLPNYLSKELRSLLEASPRFFLYSLKTSIEGNNVKINGIDLTLAGLIFQFYAFKGNLNAQNICLACVTEALERRADTAFNIVRTEEERNDRLAARMKGKLTRRTLTDAIKEYIDRNNQLSANYKKWIYANCSDQINTFVLGRKANQLKSQFSIKQIREACNTKQLKELDLVEELICREIEEGGLEPLEATQFVLATKRIRQLPIA